MKRLFTYQEGTNSIPEIFRTIPVAEKNFFLRILSFLGPGYLIAVGYIDPGNWSTDLTAGSQYGYKLLFVIGISSLLAVLMQSLAIRMGVVLNKDLAQCCSANTPLVGRVLLWLTAEIGIIATDLAELLGSAIALYLLFDIPLVYGVIITLLDVFLLLILMKYNFRYLESLILSFICIILACIVFQVFLGKPDFVDVAKGYVPSLDALKNPDMLYLSLGILGATVMPHNLYLHSAVVQSRDWKRDTKGIKNALRFANLDSLIALTIAFFMNSAILILAASAFYATGVGAVSEITDAYKLLTPLLGSGASTFFALALLFCGLSSSITATLAGQVVMEGFLHLRLAAWLRRLITRLLAGVPVIFTLLIYGDQEVTGLMNLSQVVLSLQLPLAVIPLVWFTSQKKYMGDFANPRLLAVSAWLGAIFICGLNFLLLGYFFSG